MVNDTKKTLEEINKLSRQLLSCIRSAQENIQENAVIVNEENIDSSITDNELTKLMTARDELIRLLFKQNTTDDIAQELALLNDMVSLNRELADKSQACKKILSDQFIRLKKGKKVAKSYQKY